ncbi:hypothetical protein [Streptomyces sp. NPDC059271]|uniref:hypothetical protein n=1 Tax=Streptomyces sp. NPDC059271 TaxID=3346799 RepID=UPI0036A44CC8
MDTRGAVFVLLHGPADQLPAAVESVRAAGMVAEPWPERGEDCFAAWFHNGEVNPPRSFIDECVQRTRAAVEGTGFTVGEPGVWASNAASRKFLHNRHTGEYLDQFVDVEVSPAFLAETLENIAEARGLTINDIELRDPPEFDVPLADG